MEWGRFFVHQDNICQTLSNDAVIWHNDRQNKCLELSWRDFPKLSDGNDKWHILLHLNGKLFSKFCLFKRLLKHFIEFSVGWCWLQLSNSLMSHFTGWMTYIAWIDDLYSMDRWPIFKCIITVVAFSSWSHSRSQRSLTQRSSSETLTQRSSTETLTQRSSTKTLTQRSCCSRRTINRRSSLCKIHMECMVYTTIYDFNHTFTHSGG